MPGRVGVSGPTLLPWSVPPQAVPPAPPTPPPLTRAPVENLSSEVFCFMSQLLLSFFSPSVPGESQEHFPDILKLLAPHPRLKEHVESMATEGTSHNLPKLPQVKLNSPSSLVMLRLAVVWADMGVSPASPSVPEKEEKESLVAMFFARRLYFLQIKLDFRHGPGLFFVFLFFVF